ncbi:hypothetical protein KU306_07635 [Haloferax larsenii]|uniref:Uncharacterized protein n=1 Tax=Haloferax larsenii TaxID=302484 RepID=A0ABY5RJV2_HALLR|nr:hypothetical protein [Haloferax larsenii]UVE51728.1 hypothetical protein KU306_07635 [Haloferax larsenii]
MISSFANLLETIASQVPVSLLNLVLITLTLVVTYYAFRTQKLSTALLDARQTDYSTDFLLQNTSHTSHVVLRVKMRVWLPGEDEPRDMAEFSLDETGSSVDYLYPARPGTARLPNIAYRTELGPLDFTRFRTVPPNVRLWPSTTLQTVETSGDGVTDVHVGESCDPSTMEMNDLETLQTTYQQLLSEVDAQERPMPPYIIPSDAEKIRLEIQQTGEVYELVPDNDSWIVTSKREHTVTMDGNEYRLGNERLSLRNIYYRFKFGMLRMRRKTRLSGQSYGDES